mmetsp:Transcript_3529/g.7705  ORF Transcript_3529/g.7705 Transcript_3529/m.7705 type:complete len:320 (-) Transcript_3529:145-1104(-)
MTSIEGTKLIHLTHDGNFQLETDAKVLACRIITDVEDQQQQHNDNENDGQSQQQQEQKQTIEIQVELQLDVTTMHPQGGGQPTDTGIITTRMDDDGKIDDDEGSDSYSAVIHKVTIDRSTGIVTHAGTITIPTNRMPRECNYEELFFPPNTPVKVTVDPTNRQLLSECHTAGHVVDAAMGKIDGTTNMPPIKGYHFLEGPYVEYKGAVDAKERDAFLDMLKVAFQELVDEDIPTVIQTLPISDAEPLCNRLARNFDLQNFVSPDDPDPTVRVVSTAGSTSPCGGTHARSTGVLKEREWCVKGLKCKKGVVRVRYGPVEQ